MLRSTTKKVALTDGWKLWWRMVVCVRTLTMVYLGTRKPRLATLRSMLHFGDVCAAPFSQYAQRRQPRGDRVPPHFRYASSRSVMKAVASPETQLGRQVLERMLPPPLMC